jgi:hypothetical protein
VPGAEPGHGFMNLKDLLENFHNMELMTNNNLFESHLMRGYWVLGSKIYDVNNNEHFQFVLSNPNIFGDIKGEILPDTIMKGLAKEGWIRVRYYTMGYGGIFWLIGCDSIRLRKTNIKDFCYWAIKKGLMGYHDKVTLLGLEDSDQEVYEGGVTTLLSEKTKITNK